MEKLSIRECILDLRLRWFLNESNQLMHAGMNVEASNGYKALQSLESKILLRDLWLEQDPTKYREHLRRFVLDYHFIITTYSIGYAKVYHFNCMLHFLRNACRVFGRSAGHRPGNCRRM